MQQKQKRLSHEELIALRGLRLPAVALKRLKAAQIFASPAISIERHSTRREYILRAEESGGSTADIGAYCGFVGMDGTPLPSLQRAQSVGVNGPHAIVVASRLARVQMFRTENMCELLITCHELKPVEYQEKPVLKNRILFHGSNAVLPPNPESLPSFLNRAGEPQEIPAQFSEAIVRTSRGLSCRGCRHVHVLESGLTTTTTSTIHVLGRE